MREAYFRKLNQDKWDDKMELSNIGADEIANNFIEISQDLSFAKTFYPRSELVLLLNQITGNYFSKIYKNKKEKKGVFIWFWKKGLPEVMFKNRALLAYSFSFFLITSLLGSLAAHNNPAFVKMVLGESYIQMTQENISKGDPFGVYKSYPSILMFLMIMANNIYVSFQIFVNGIFFGAGTLFFLFKNGIMLGSFQYYFFSKGLGFQSILVIWVHGTLEISAIVISGMAGLRLGLGLLFPGTLSRKESMQLAALEGIKVIIGLIPVFMLAAFLEGFVTARYKMPIYISVSILVISFLFILYYFVIYPSYIFKFKSQIKSIDHGRPDYYSKKKRVRRNTPR